jgi:hypothetical protein
LTNVQDVGIEIEGVSEKKSKKLKDLPIISENSRKIDMDFTVDDGCQIIEKVFLAAAEREISVGDGVNIWIIRSNKNEDEKDIINKKENEPEITTKKINFNNDYNKQNEKSKIIYSETNPVSFSSESNAENKEKLINTSKLIGETDDTKKKSFLPSPEGTSKKILKRISKKNIGKKGFFTIEKRNFFSEFCDVVS